MLKNLVISGGSIPMKFLAKMTDGKKSEIVAKGKGVIRLKIPIQFEKKDC